MVTTGDFNGNGKADVLEVYEYNPGNQPTSFEYSVLFGNGNGTFRKIISDAPIQSTAVPSAYLPKPLVADMNGEGKSDLIQIGGPAEITIYLSNRDGTFTQNAGIAPGQTPVSLAIADFNNDGLPDIVSTGASLTSILINTSERVPRAPLHPVGRIP
jgi:hypothetical protein